MNLRDELKKVADAKRVRFRGREYHVITHLVSSRGQGANAVGVSVDPNCQFILTNDPGVLGSQPGDRVFTPEKEAWGYSVGEWSGEIGSLGGILVHPDGEAFNGEGTKAIREVMKRHVWLGVHDVLDVEIIE